MTDRHEQATILATCMPGSDRPTIQHAGYFRLLRTDKEFMLSLAPTDGDQPTVVAGSLDMSVGEFLGRLSLEPSAIMQALFGNGTANAESSHK